MASKTAAGKATRTASAGRSAPAPETPKVKLGPRRKERSGHNSLQDSWRDKTVEQLAAEQGIGPIRRLEEVLGAGAHLWKDDPDLDDFLREIYRRRKQERFDGR